MMTDKELNELYLGLKAWHENVKSQASICLDESKDINIENKEGDKIKLNEVQATCFRMGVRSILRLIDEFPIKIKQNENKI